MLNMMKSVYKKYFSNPEAALLILFLLTVFILLWTVGQILAPVITSLVIVYLLQWWVSFLVTHKIPRKIAYFLIYILFLAIFSIVILVLLPLLWRQVTNLFTDLPNMLQTAKSLLINVAEKYPAYFSKEQIDTLVFSILKDIQIWAKTKVSSYLLYIPGLIEWLVYLFLVPLLVFFFLKDRDIIIRWFVKFLPKDRKVLNTIWAEMNKQIGNYIRGKIVQITIVSVANVLVFLYFNLNYAILLAFIIGVSVIVPYVGGVIVTIPLILVGYLQWGFSWQLGYMLLAYAILQAIDANIIVPILFSKAVNLHPIAIIVAVLFFGSIWGLLGIIFAIPLATLVNTILVVWPISSRKN